MHLYADVVAQGCVGLEPNIDTFLFSVNAATARTLLHSVGKSWLQSNRAVRVQERLSGSRSLAASSLLRDAEPYAYTLR